ncbi:MAG: lysophospholipase [Candidatus Obscuribacterales bacterium]|nr:lysophospholipase [Candidatus Obscuribacterales bacterium]
MRNKINYFLTGLMSSLFLMIILALPIIAEPVSSQCPDETRALGLPVVRWQDCRLPVRAVVVAVHGFTLYTESFDSTARHLASRGYVVYGSDLRGFGRWREEPEKFDGDSTIDYGASRDDLIMLLKELRKQYRDKQIILMGESMGANLAVWVASCKPQLIDGLILSALCYKQRVKPRWRWIPDTLKGLFNPLTPMSLDPYVREDVSHNPDIITSYLKDSNIRLDVTPVKLVKVALVNRVSLSDVDKIPAELPILIVCGEKDRLFKTRSVPRIVNKMGSNNVDFHVLAGWGHLILEAQTLDDRVGKILDDWIDISLSDRRVSLDANLEPGAGEKMSAKP